MIYVFQRNDGFWPSKNVSDSFPAGQPFADGPPEVATRLNTGAVPDQQLRTVIANDVQVSAFFPPRAPEALCKVS